MDRKTVRGPFFGLFDTRCGQVLALIILIAITGGVCGGLIAAVMGNQSWWSDTKENDVHVVVGPTSGTSGPETPHVDVSVLRPPCVETTTPAAKPSSSMGQGGGGLPAVPLPTVSPLNRNPAFLEGGGKEDGKGGMRGVGGTGGSAPTGIDPGTGTSNVGTRPADPKISWRNLSVVNLQRSLREPPEISSSASISIPVSVSTPTASDEQLEEMLCEGITTDFEFDYDYEDLFGFGLPSLSTLRTRRFSPDGHFLRLLTAISFRIRPSISDILKDILPPLTAAKFGPDDIVWTLGQLAQNKDNVEAVLALLDLLTFTLNDREPEWAGGSLGSQTDRRLKTLLYVRGSGRVDQTLLRSLDIVPSPTESHPWAWHIFNEAVRDALNLEEREKKFFHRESVFFLQNSENLVKVKQSEEEKQLVKRRVVKNIVGTYLTCLKDVIKRAEMNVPIDERSYRFQFP